MDVSTRSGGHTEKRRVSRHPVTRSVKGGTLLVSSFLILVTSSGCIMERGQIEALLGGKTTVTVPGSLLGVDGPVTYSSSKNVVIDVTNLSEGPNFGKPQAERILITGDPQFAERAAGVRSVEGGRSEDFRANLSALASEIRSLTATIVPLVQQLSAQRFEQEQQRPKEPSFAERLLEALKDPDIQALLRDLKEE